MERCCISMPHPVGSHVHCVLGDWLSAVNMCGFLLFELSCRDPLSLSCTARQSLSAFSGASLCLMSCYSKTQPMSQERKWEPSCQKPIGCPYPLTFPEGTVSSIEHDLTTGCHSVGDEKLLESGRSTWTLHTHFSQLSTPLQSLASACSDLWGRSLKMEPETCPDKARYPEYFWKWGYQFSVISKRDFLSTVNWSPILCRVESLDLDSLSFCR